MTVSTQSQPIEAFVAYATRTLHLAVARATERRGHAFDPLRSLYVADREADEILSSGAGARALAPVGDPPVGGLPNALAQRLSPFERAVLALLAGVAVIPRVDRVIGFLHDDLTRRHVTVGLLLDLFAAGLDERKAACEALSADGVLVRLRLIALSADDQTLASVVQCEAGSAARLCGTAGLDRRLAPYAVFHRALDRHPTSECKPVMGRPMVLWDGTADVLQRATLQAAAVEGVPLLRLAAGTPPELLSLAAREALFGSAWLAVATTTPPEALHAARSLGSLPLPIVIEAPAGIVALDGLDDHRVGLAPRPADTPSIAQPLPYGRRLVPRRSFERLVLPAGKVRALRSIAARVKHRATVIDEWGLDTGSSAGGVRCLFSGPPGTGKTLAAEVIAAELRRDLYLIDVSTVVSKYIGETEKILSQIFAEAMRARVCLFFDEADALFGKRGEQKDAHDKYANIETAYLLQAIDAYPDLVVLASNMRNNLDDALSRRIDVFVDFTMPDVSSRVRLWEMALADAPQNEVDARLLAARFTISGGAIQNAALTAAFAAAADGRAVTMLDLVRAARDELSKSGKVAGRMELGEHYDVLKAES